MTKVLRLLDWADYMAPAVLARFEAETGIHVEDVYYSSEEECVARITAGESFDVVMADDMSAVRLRHTGLLQPLDMDRLPRFRHVTNERLRRPPHDPETDGRKYTSVMHFGSEGFMARLDKVGRLDTSWEMLFDPAHAGDICMIDGAREVLSVGLYLLGGDANSTDAAFLEQATDMMIGQRSLVREYDTDRPWQKTVDGVALVHCWDGDAVRALTLGALQVRYVLPKEGFTMWLDAPCIPVSAGDPAGAHRFLDFVLEPEVAAANADYSGYQPVVEAAAPLLKHLLQRSMRPSELQIEAGTFHDDLGDFNVAYEEAYRRVRAA